MEIISFGKVGPDVSELVPLLPRRAKVLDLGCGEGRHSLFLTEHGFDVTAVDISAHGIGKLEYIAAAKRLELKTETQDMRSYRFKAAMISSFLMAAST